MLKNKKENKPKYNEKMCVSCIHLSLNPNKGTSTCKNAKESVSLFNTCKKFSKIIHKEPTKKKAIA